MSSAAEHPAASLSSHPWINAYPVNVSWDQVFEPAAVFKLLDDAVRDFPASTCTNFLGKTETYAEIGAAVERAAAGLQSLGIGRGNKVGLFLPNSPTFIIYYFAALKTGATIVNFNPLYAVEELEYQAKDSGTDLMITLDLKVLFDKVDALLVRGTLPRAIVCSFASLLPATKSILFRLMKGKEIANTKGSKAADRILLEADVLRAAKPFQPVAIDAGTDIAVLQYTGGTTGTPKGAMLTHANCYVNVMQVRAWAPELRAGQERVLGILPFFHVFAMTVVMNLGIAVAAEIVIMPRFALNDAMKLIDKLKPTIMPGVPTLFGAISNHPQLKKFDLRSLQFCLSGGAPLPVEIKNRFESLTGCRVVEGYGLSETSPVATSNAVLGEPRHGSIGVPLPATIISLRDLDDPTKEVPLGEKGEICIAGPQVMKGYWNKPAETAATFVGKFLRTGDVARMDKDGYLYIEDRIKDLIICSGFNVYPRRIEEAIYTHPAVEEVTVIGIPDDYRGEAPKAFIKLKTGMSADSSDILEHLEPKLSKFELPAQIEFRDGLPKTMIGKLSKKELKAEEAERRRT